MRFQHVAGIIAAVFMAACTADGTPAPVVTNPAATSTGTTAPAAAPSAAPAATPATSPAAANPTPPGAPPQAPFNPQGFRLMLERLPGAFSQPVFVTHAGDGSGRLFVVERAGRIRTWSGRAAQTQPFLDIRSIVRSAGSEQGLLGLEFHPSYRQNGRFFVYYTASNGDNTVAEYRVSADPARANPATAKVFFAIPAFAPNHNGGMLGFGPDGSLYVGTGDGGGAGDPQRTALNPGALLGIAPATGRQQRRAVRHSAGESLCGKGRRPTGGVGVRPAQPVALQL